MAGSLHQDFQPKSMNQNYNPTKPKGELNQYYPIIDFSFESDEESLNQTSGYIIMAVRKTENHTNTPRKRPTTEMEIIENPKEWVKSFQEGWMAKIKKTGKFDWKQYISPKNRSAPSGKRVDLSKSRLLLISTAGGYLHESQKPFEASSKFGDYSIRLFPSDTPFEALSYAHEHYDHQYIDKDPQVLLPLRHLEDMVSKGIIGEISPNVVSFSGYQPNVIRVVKEMIPEIVEVALRDQVNAALLVPA